MVEDENPDLLTVRQVSEQIYQSVRRVRQLLTKGELQGQKFGRKWLVSPSEVERYRLGGSQPDKRGQDPLEALRARRQIEHLQSIHDSARRYIDRLALLPHGPTSNDDIPGYVEYARVLGTFLDDLVRDPGWPMIQGHMDPEYGQQVQSSANFLENFNPLEWTSGVRVPTDEDRRLLWEAERDALQGLINLRGDMAPYEPGWIWTPNCEWCESIPESQNPSAPAP